MLLYAKMFCFCQTRDTSINYFSAFDDKPWKPEILTGGLIDVVQNGQMNASARLFRLYIGEPGKLQIPVSLYSGVSANNFSFNRQDEEVVLNLINPGSGIFNLSFDGNNKFLTLKSKMTCLRFQYQTGFRVLNVFNKNIQKYQSFFNNIIGLGLTFITGAWERNKLNNLGIFWLNIRGLFSNNPLAILKELLEDSISKNIYGYSTGIGIEISQALNVKIFYFHFLNNRQIRAFTQPYVQLSFNYTTK